MKMDRRTPLRPSPTDVLLRVMATSDLHMHLMPYDYYSDRPDPGIGLTRIAGLVHQNREVTPNTLLLDNGDYLQGSPMADMLARGALSKATPHPAIAAMNQLGYDSGTLGNHEFNYGVSYLDQVNAQAAFPMVSANFARSLGESPEQDDLVLPPYVILTREFERGDGKKEPVRIGVIGFLPPQVTVWDRRHLGTRFVTRDIVEAARAWVPAIKTAGADVIIALCHSGIANEAPRNRMENAAVPLSEVPGIDAIVLGHQHRVFPGPGFAAGPGVDPVNGTLNGKPAAMPGRWGSHLALIDLVLRKTKDGWSVKESSSQCQSIAVRDSQPPVELVSDDDTLLDRLAPCHAATLDFLRRPVGYSSAPLNSYFALVAPNPVMSVVSKAQLWYASERLEDDPERPLLSAVAPFKSGAFGNSGHYTDIPAGPLAMRHVADMYVYPNTLTVVEANGADLRAWLERSASLFRQVPLGSKDAPLFSDNPVAYNFDVIYGLTYEVDVSSATCFRPCDGGAAEGRGRIRNIRFNGSSVTPDMTFRVVTNSYRADGGGSFPGLPDLQRCHDGTESVQEILTRYVRQTEDIAPPDLIPWRFSALPATTATFVSSSIAKQHLNRVEAYGVRYLNDLPSGNAQFRVSFEAIGRSH